MSYNDKQVVNVSPARIKKSHSYIKRGVFYGLIIGGVTMYITNNYNTKLIFHYKPTTLNEKIIQNCPELKKGKFRPTWFLPTTFMQCFYGAKIDPIPFVPYERERVPLSDGGALYVDWGPVFSSHDKEDAKILLICHGLTGSADCNYIKEAVLEARKNGFRPVAINMRGFGDTPVIETPQYFNFADTSDLRQTIDFIKRKYPKADVFGMGISIGANLLLKYAGESKEGCQLKAVVSLANPYDLLKCSEKIEHFSKWIYDHSLTKGFKRLFEKNQEMLKKNPKLEFDPKEVLAAKSSRQFDEKLTRRIHGYHDLDEYYRSAGCQPYIKDIKVPVLCINSLEDPVIDKSIIARDDIRENENMILVETLKGGHIDWFTSRSPQRWAYWPAMEYLNYIEGHLNGHTQPKKAITEKK